MLDVGVLNTDLDEDDELDVVGVEDDDDAADDAWLDRFAELDVLLVIDLR